MFIVYTLLMNRGQGQETKSSEVTELFEPSLSGVSNPLGRLLDIRVLVSDLNAKY